LFFGVFGWWYFGHTPPPPPTERLSFVKFIFFWTKYKIPDSFLQEKKS
jgi:hypothetical protein